jgi:protoheme IX farnesyltransferase
MAYGLLKEYIQLTKPTIVVLVAVTGLATMAAEGHLFREPLDMLLVLAAIILSAGSANSLNQYIDRDIDALMDRTARKRPLPRQQLSPYQALGFGLFLGIVSNAYLWLAAHWLAAVISVATILFYTLVYTIWLKRRYYYNIVIGGAAGATAPLIASAAATGETSALSWIFFALIFFWTPPHFWALALAIKDQYEKVKVPMLPNVLGDKRTKWEIVLYTIFLLPLSLLPMYLGLLGRFYALAAVGLWVWYMIATYKNLKENTKPAFMKLFAVSIFYLFLLFIAAAIDGAFLL